MALAASRHARDAHTAESNESLCTPVLPGLFIGPFLYAKSLGWLRRHGITHVVNATASAPSLHLSLIHI